MSLLCYLADDFNINRGINGQCVTLTMSQTVA